MKRARCIRCALPASPFHPEAGRLDRPVCNACWTSEDRRQLTKAGIQTAGGISPEPIVRSAKTGSSGTRCRHCGAVTGRQQRFGHRFVPLCKHCWENRYSPEQRRKIAAQNNLKLRKAGRRPGPNSTPPALEARKRCTRCSVPLDGRALGTQCETCSSRPRGSGPAISIVQGGAPGLGKRA